jgi:hypothetical protein
MDKEHACKAVKFISGILLALDHHSSANNSARSYSNQTHKRTRRVMEFYSYSSVPTAKFGEGIHAGDYTEETSNWTTAWHHNVH